jgi:hypothetical protein
MHTYILAKSLKSTPILYESPESIVSLLTRLVRLVPVLLQIRLQFLGLPMTYLNGSDSRIICFLELDGAVTYVFAWRASKYASFCKQESALNIHLFPSLQKVLRVRECNKAIFSLEVVVSTVCINDKNTCIPSD